MFRVSFVVDEFVSNGFIGHFEGQAIGQNGLIKSLAFDESETVVCDASDETGEPVCRCDIDDSVWAGIVEDVRQHIEDNFDNYEEQALRSERDWRDSLVCDVRGR